MNAVGFGISRPRARLQIAPALKDPGIKIVYASLLRRGYPD
jgi:hypothetical protein